MNSQDISTHYEAVLADLEAKKLRIEATIASIKDVLQLEHTLTTGSISKKSLDIEVGMFFGMSIIGAVEKYLSLSPHKPKSFKEIQEALKKGSLEVQTSTLSSILSRAIPKHECKIVKVGRGLFGLTDWYPGNGKKKKNSLEKNKNDDIQEPEQILKANEEIS